MPDQLKTMQSAFGEYALKRIPANEKLQAWDAADLYLLQHVKDAGLLNTAKQVLIVNDQFGALSVALAECQPTMMSDSFLSRLALQHNLYSNSHNEAQVTFSDCLQPPRKEFDLVFIKIPKSLALLEQQLYLLRDLVSVDTHIVASAMTRNVHNSTLRLFESILGPSKTSLAWKKSRLIHVNFDPDLEVGECPYPDKFVVEAGEEFSIYNHAGVFSREKLDPGARLLIENMPVSDLYKDIIDLGCGNGILGLVAASINSQATLHFVDESYMAVESARRNFESAFSSGRQAEFHTSHCLQGIADESADVILNNPPFHQQHSVGDSIAWQMFVDARRVLKPQAELWVVGNRHLGYHNKLKKIFGNCINIAGNSKFVVLKATRAQV